MRISEYIVEKSRGLLKWSTSCRLLSIILFVAYLYLFLDGVAPYWFNPAWTTDDALQQNYPFWKVIYPELFHGDIVTQMMEGYLSPIHYWTCYFVTFLTRDPVMMGHWVMLIQLVLLLLFVFLAVKEAAGITPAFFAMTWMLHTRHVIQRLTAGLPRGWSAPLIAAWMYWVIKGNHKAVLATLFVGCLLHPPSTLILALAYGLYLVWNVLWPSSRQAFLKPLIIYIILSPVFLVTVLSVVRMPPEIGTMASLEKAASMPEFSKSGGRFQFVPLNPVKKEIRIFGTQAFLSRFFDADAFWKKKLPMLKWLCEPCDFWRDLFPLVLVGLLLMAWLIGRWRKMEIMPQPLWFFLLSSFVVYFASRILAFRLYVPDRHLQFPLAIFFVVGLTIAAWRSFHKMRELPGLRDDTMRVALGSFCALVFLGGLVCAGSGSGLNGSANFNMSIDWRSKEPLITGNIWNWVKNNTPINSVIAGDPTFIDGCQLFGARQAYITTETAHPFYDKYYETIKPRIEKSFRALYARSLEDLVAIMEPEGVDYFIFRRSAFRQDGLDNAKYFTPYDTLVKELASYPRDSYAYFKLPKRVDMERYPFMPYNDGKYAVVVDIRRLKEWLAEKKKDEGKIEVEGSNGI